MARTLTREVLDSDERPLIAEIKSVAEALRNELMLEMPNRETLKKLQSRARDAIHEILLNGSSNIARRMFAWLERKKEHLTSAFTPIVGNTEHKAFATMLRLVWPETELRQDIAKRLHVTVQAMNQACDDAEALPYEPDRTIDWMPILAGALENVGTMGATVQVTLTETRLRVGDRSVKLSEGEILFMEELLNSKDLTATETQIEQRTGRNATNLSMRTRQKAEAVGILLEIVGVPGGGTTTYHFLAATVRAT